LAHNPVLISGASVLLQDLVLFETGWNPLSCVLLIKSLKAREFESMGALPAQRSVNEPTNMFPETCACLLEGQNPLFSSSRKH